MRKTDFGHRQFHYDTPCFGRITTVYPVGPDAKVGPFFPPNRLYVDVQVLDNRGYCFKALVLTPPGFTANCRKGMTVCLHFLNGNPQNAVVTLHHYNADPTSYSNMNVSAKDTSAFANPLPSMFQNLDDVLMHHHGSSAFMRAGGLGSSATQAQVDGGPGIITLGLASAFKNPTQSMPFSASPILTLEDYAPPVTTPPTKPTQAKLSIAMPNGATFVLDEPTASTSTLLYTHPTGAMLMCDAMGTWTITAGSSGPEIVINEGGSGAIELGADSLTLSSDGVVTVSKLQTLANEIIANVQTAFTTFAAHVQSGSGAPPPTVAAVTATGSDTTESKE